MLYVISFLLQIMLVLAIVDVVFRSGSIQESIKKLAKDFVFILCSWVMLLLLHIVFTQFYQLSRQILRFLGCI